MKNKKIDMTNREYSIKFSYLSIWMGLCVCVCVCVCLIGVSKEEEKRKDAKLIFAEIMFESFQILLKPLYFINPKLYDP